MRLIVGENQFVKMKSARGALCFISAALSLGVVGCKKVDAEVSGAETQTVSYPLQELWTKKTLKVCWEHLATDDRKMASQITLPNKTCNESDDPQVNLKKFQVDVETLVTTNLDKTVLKLVGWQQCEKENEDIRIFVYDDPENEINPVLGNLKKGLKNSRSTGGHPRVRGHGEKSVNGSVPLANLPAGLVLNMSFVDVEPEIRAIWDSMNTQGKANLAVSAALHEIGHGVGLRHEDSAPGKTCHAFDEDLGTGVSITKYNPFSFMSRCFYRRANYALGPVELNEFDIQGINETYRRKDLVK